MHTIHTVAAIAAAALLCACSNGGGGDETGSANGGGTTTYAKTTPVAGTRDTFTTAIVDDEDNTIDGGYEQQVTAVNADGSYVLHQDDPSGNSVTVDGVVYHFNDQVLQFDAQGRETSYVITRADGSTESCTAAQQGGDHALPWYVGQAWTQQVAITCAGGGTETETISGTVVAVESVAVPAGTFQALKLQETVTSDTSTGLHVVETTTHWRDPADSLFLLKSTTTFAYSGNAPLHHPISKTVLLSARSSS